VRHVEDDHLRPHEPRHPEQRGPDRSRTTHRGGLDDDAARAPDNEEEPYDGIDQDCDGADLDDLDGDGFARLDDCDDGDAGIHPGATEGWGNAFADDDCDGALEQEEPALFGDTLWYSSTVGAAFGSRVEPFVDVDGDGTSEALVSAVTASRTYTNSGAVYLVSSAGSGDVDDGALGVIDAGGPDWYLGVSVDARDLDGDGFPEVVTTATGKDTTGAGFLIDGATLAAGTVLLPDDAAHTFEGSEPFSYWGSDIAFLGDIDGDGFEEVAMSASYANVGGTESAGRVVVFSLAETTHATAEPHVSWEGYYAGGRFGETVVSVGDVDDDGLPDTLVSAEEGDIFVVVPGVSGSIVDVALSRVTREGDSARYRSVPVGDLDGADGTDILLLGAESAFVFTGLGTFSVRTQRDAWMTIVADEGSQFADATSLGDQTGDGLPETLLTRTWSPADGTTWAGVLISDGLEWRVETDADAFELRALSNRPDAGLGLRTALLEGAARMLVFAGPTDDRGATGGGSVAMLAAPN
jgi:hypothetical protein